MVANFAELTRTGVESFIQTVLVIDNELTLRTDDEPIPAAALVTPSASLKDTTRSAADLVVDSPAAATPLPSPLDAKQIMDAFLKRSMICGMHKPNRGDDLVGEAIQAARRSDAVIIDWMLEQSDSRAAKDIIAGILDGDTAENGRLRLIAVYTSEPDVVGVTRQIREHLAQYTFVDGSLGVLTKPNTRIVVLNKDETPGAPAQVKIGDLPARIIEEFAHLSAGILSTFAVSAIAAVRRQTHHVLAIFSQQLDSAFLGHMCAIPSPEDAKEFALDLLAGELRSVASMNADTNATLEAHNLALHIDTLAKDGHLCIGDVRVPIDVAREFPALGQNGVNGSRARQITRDGQEVPKVKAVNDKNVGLLFQETDDDGSHLRFARFASFRTEPFGRSVLPKGWAPTLSLGSLMVRLKDDGSLDSDGYLLCTQPRCDALRIRGVRGFPFQRAFKVEVPAFDLVAAIPTADGKTADVLLAVSAKPFDGRMIEFQAGADQRVKATKQANGRFEFKDVDDASYVWLGDLRDLGAQRAASRVAARMHEVGLDEFEWLRLKAQARS